MLYYIMEYCCFGKKARKEKQLLKVIKEYILINDFSTDSSLSIINNYIDKKKNKKKNKDIQ